MLRTPAPALVLALVLASCVEGRESPPLTDQATVAYAGRIYLVDDSRDRQSVSDCTLLTSVAGTPNATTVFLADGSTLSSSLMGMPHNCFVKVTPKTLPVDRVEVSNELFQLCIDSGACERPDPSKASKSQVCQSDGAFDQCPVVEATLEQAGAFCDWIGRRLPTSMEQILIRQVGGRTKAAHRTAGLTQCPTEAGRTDDDGNELCPLDIPVLPNSAPGVANPNRPASCDDAVLGNICGTPPRPHSGTGDGTAGGAALDKVTTSDGDIFDLIGNVSEWSSDQFPADRGRGSLDTLPWFCTRPLARGTDVCPSGSTCIYGQYQFNGVFRTDWPVCITTDTGRFSGTVGALAGGSWRDTNIDSNAHIGTFSRRTESQPNLVSDTKLSQEFGFRCVDDRTVNADGTIPEFTNRLELLP